jgi:hypothetical protein
LSLRTIAGKMFSDNLSPLAIDCRNISGQEHIYTFYIRIKSCIFNKLLKGKRRCCV